MSSMDPLRIERRLHRLREQEQALLAEHASGEPARPSERMLACQACLAHLEQRLVGVAVPTPLLTRVRWRVLLGA